jgi:hypothetical protein
MSEQDTRNETAEVRSLLKTIQEKQISSETYMQTYNEVNQMAKTINTMLDGKKHLYTEKVKLIQAIEADPHFEEDRLKGIVEVAAYTLCFEIVNIQKEIIDWRTIYCALLLEVMRKSMHLFEVGKSIEIRSEALKAQRDMLDEYHKTQVEVVENKLNIVDEKFARVLEVMDSNNRNQMDKFQENQTSMVLKVVELLSKKTSPEQTEVQKSFSAIHEQVTAPVETQPLNETPASLTSRSKVSVNLTGQPKSFSDINTDETEDDGEDLVLVTQDPLEVDKKTDTAADFGLGEPEDF